ncbi:DUF4430 domain-containing protein [uncultured Clostridium sp.]|jgi:hypothetical protein|uniref:DUF4430 domain-containing protein n=1 Tax=uncultured Clostridium sp. TaxID=59620 RepID=UPI00260C8717|nr:DUF4430 domain-containing protein [uncultured Clostridium sp.]
MTKKLITIISITSFIIIAAFITIGILNMPVSKPTFISKSNAIAKQTMDTPDNTDISKDEIIKEDSPSNLNTENNSNKDNPSNENNSNTNNTITSDNNTTNENNSTTENIVSERFITVSLTGVNNNNIGTYKVEIDDTISVFEATEKAFSKNNINIKSRGIRMTKYVYSINGLAEFDHGGSSGWMYKVNGVFPNKSCGSFDVYPNDMIHWVYTLDGGKDVGAR